MRPPPDPPPLPPTNSPPFREGRHARGSTRGFGSLRPPRAITRLAPDSQLACLFDSSGRAPCTRSSSRRASGASSSRPSRTPLDAWSTTGDARPPPRSATLPACQPQPSCLPAYLSFCLSVGLPACLPAGLPLSLPVCTSPMFLAPAGWRPVCLSLSFRLTVSLSLCVSLSRSLTHTVDYA